MSQTDVIPIVRNLILTCMSKLRESAGVEGLSAVEVFRSRKEEEAEEEVAVKELGKGIGMKRWLCHFTIVIYLMALSWGIVAHALSFGANAHPGMYFVVWDMFCGWSAYSSRTEIIGEGESGTYYQLAPGPWGEFKPFGDLGRRHYDQNGNLSYKLAMNTLKHTEHEPMARIIVVEKSWAKKFNLPDHLYAQRFGKPKNKHVYNKVRYVFTPEGVVLSSASGWLSEQFARVISSNPRLQAETQRRRPMFAFDLNNRSRLAHQSADPFDPYQMVPTRARAGN